MAANPTPNYISVEEYLRREETAEFKSEYFNGEIFPMFAATPQHALISTNVVSVFKHMLKSKPCGAYSNGILVKTPTGLYTYPDLAVVCGDVSYAEGRRDAVTNPLLIVEVSSPSTEDYDQGKKSHHYRTIETLIDYLTVSQELPYVEHWSRQGENRWLLVEYSGMEQQIELSSIGCILSLTDIYDKISFPGGAVE